MNNRKKSWFTLTDRLFNEVKSNEQLSMGLIGEESLFLRFNNGNLRQATHVEQFKAELIFQAELRKIQFNFSLTGNDDVDFATAHTLLLRARDEIKILPEDTLSSMMKNNGLSDHDHNAQLPTEEKAIKDILESHGDVDFSGFYSGGPLYRASRNSTGQNHWFSTQAFFYDYSLFTVSDQTHENKAVKGNYSEKNWNFSHLSENIQSSTNQLGLLRKPGKKLQPGGYRAYLAPGAVSEILSVLDI
jgi:predicted Zn-dependent protease